MAQSSRLHVHKPTQVQVHDLRPPPVVLPVLRIGEDIVEFLPKFKYIGMWFTSTHRNMFAAHYAEKASKARKVANTTFGAVKDRLAIRDGGDVGNFNFGWRDPGRRPSMLKAFGKAFTNFG
ncbi:hypothetical protein B0H17DRAFT_1132242 [Mycena rosella]|uniref:Uncharacterized protein n=1 Tax=Mycena rosella TaxID=1033263 RepID=A0AAD7DMN0_MYCRO|nr:hypothetical protein B0H17DRAFT_1132242 [Mycena rosella]